jgi:macrodomain Ter protein organizer (MatP/YcbG family)
MHNKPLHHLYNILEEMREEFEKIASVTARHVRPTLLLRWVDAHFAKKVQNDLFQTLNASKPFSGSRKTEW